MAIFILANLQHLHLELAQMEINLELADIFTWKDLPQRRPAILPKFLRHSFLWPQMNFTVSNFGIIWTVPMLAFCKAGFNFFFLKFLKIILKIWKKFDSGKVYITERGYRTTRRMIWSRIGPQGGDWMFTEIPLMTLGG